VILTNHIRTAARHASRARRWLLPCLFVVLMLVGHDALMTGNARAAAPVGRERVMGHARPRVVSTTTGHGDADTTTTGGYGPTRRHHAACGLGQAIVVPPTGEQCSAPVTEVVPVGATWVLSSTVVTTGAMNAPTASPAVRRALLQVYRL